MSAGTAIIIGVVCFLVGAVISWFVSKTYNKNVNDKKVGSAEERSRAIIDDAIKAAEEKKREAEIEIKEKSIKSKDEIEKESRERRSELQKYERRVLQKEEDVEKRSEQLDRLQKSLDSKHAAVDKQREELRVVSEQRAKELERISGLTSDQAKDLLLSSVEEELNTEVAKRVKAAEVRAKEEADAKAREVVVTAIQRSAVDHVAEAVITVVQLPNDEMKGRIIGREGRNIRAIEQQTGVDLIVDDTPDAVILSCFDPVRREIARIALEKLIVDGRIHPARIEETVAKAQKEVEKTIKEEGDAAVLEVGVHGLHPELIKLLGKLRYRTSYGQNVLKHSKEVAILSGLIAAEIGCDVRVAKRAGLLHDIGKAIDHEVDGSHVQLGVDLCKKYKESNIIVNAVAAHHGDCEPESLIACIVQASDAISAARPGARREALDAYTNRLTQLEDICNAHKGVEKSFAVQAGREVRVMVVPDKIDDAQMVLLGRDIVKEIEDELEYPGQIKVNIIRESRVTDYAK